MASTNNSVPFGDKKILDDSAAMHAPQNAGSIVVHASTSSIEAKHQPNGIAGVFFTDRLTSTRAANTTQQSASNPECFAGLMRVPRQTSPAPLALQSMPPARHATEFTGHSAMAPVLDPCVADAYGLRDGIAFTNTSFFALWGSGKLAVISTTSKGAQGAPIILDQDSKKHLDTIYKLSPNEILSIKGRELCIWSFTDPENPRVYEQFFLQCRPHIQACCVISPDEFIVALDNQTLCTYSRQPFGKYWRETPSCPLLGAAPSEASSASKSEKNTISKLVPMTDNMFLACTSEGSEFVYRRTERTTLWEAQTIPAERRASTPIG